MDLSLLVQQLNTDAETVLWYLGTPSQSVLEDWSSVDHFSPQQIMSVLSPTIYLNYSQYGIVQNV